MAEEQQVEVVEELDAPEVAEEQAPEIPQHEVEARDKGWRPEEEYEGDKPWVDAATFLDRGQFMDTISKQKKQLDRVQRDLEALKQHNAGIEKAAIERARAELRAAKAQAYSDNDGETLVEIEGREKEIQTREEALQETADANPHFQEWLSNNDWYENDKVMHDWADTYAQGLQASNPGYSPEQIMTVTTDEVKARFADKFAKKPALPKHGLPSGNQGGHGAPKDLWGQMSDIQKKIATDFERDGVMSKKEYAKQLNEANLLGQ